MSNNTIYERDHDFKRILAEGVKAYFSSFNENVEIFSEFDINNLPLPENDPFLTDKGVGFIYSQYEIAPYSSGQPAFVVPYHIIKAYLTEDVLKVVPDMNENLSISSYNANQSWQSK